MRSALFIAATLVVALPFAGHAAKGGLHRGSDRPAFLPKPQRVSVLPALTLGFPTAQRNALFFRPGARFGTALRLSGLRLSGAPQRNAFFAQRNALFGGRAQREPTPDEIWWDEAASGKITWTKFVENLETLGAARPFETQAFSQSPQRYTFLGQDTGHQHPKFVVVRDLQSRGILDLGAPVRDRETGEPVIDKATGKPLTIKKAIEMQGGDPRAYDHAVSVATPNPREHKQPVWLHQVNAQTGAAHLGRMLRDVLGVLPAKHQLSWATQAYVNMPGVITVPRLHAHGVWRSDKAPKVKDWDAFVRSNNYQQVADQGDFVIYKAPRNAQNLAASLPLLAVAKDAKLTTAKLGASTDKLLGQMYLDVASTALQSPRAFAGALQRGRIEIDSTDNRLVVRLYERPAEQDLEE